MLSCIICYRVFPTVDIYVQQNEIGLRRIWRINIRVGNFECGSRKDVYFKISSEKGKYVCKGQKWL